VSPRAIVVADRSWRDEALDAGWRLEDLFERRVHRSLTRYVHVLERA
jgi:tRNA (guanine10-N2)-dimethyltransferase